MRADGLDYVHTHVCERLVERCRCCRALVRVCAHESSLPFSHNPLQVLGLGGFARYLARYLLVNHLVQLQRQPSLISLELPASFQRTARQLRLPRSCCACTCARACA